MNRRRCDAESGNWNDESKVPLIKECRQPPEAEKDVTLIIP